MKKQCTAPPSHKLPGVLAFVGSLSAAWGAALAPCCFPLLGFAAVMSGWAGWESGAPWLIQGAMLIALIGFGLGRNQFGGRFSLATSLVSAALISMAYQVFFHAVLVYVGLGLLMIAALGPWAYRFGMRVIKKPILRSTLACPACGNRHTETMPMDACLFFWNCPRCGARVRPREGDCCVFCSYGTIPCPPVQLGGCAC